MIPALVLATPDTPVRRVVHLLTMAVGVAEAVTVARRVIPVTLVAEVQMIGNSKILSMKILLILLLPLSAFSQETKTLEYPPKYFTGQAVPANRDVVKPDTLRAELLVTYTTRRWGVAHSRDGYVVRKDGKVIRFLDDQKRRFPPNTRLWGWIDLTEKILP